MNTIGASSCPKTWYTPNKKWLSTWHNTSSCKAHSDRIPQRPSSARLKTSSSSRSAVFLHLGEQVAKGHEEERTEGEDDG
eukprot:CAMPEP_0183503302 /NCGR_PEP_ID=MMETSP0371-20130417/5011_1 /TAXON_ID=268820 /ORGANISM="Peridinium aciculiferum, Strain PAER-2" /LENGTH=79 /DNA_ID=CAMNT_0025698359 /DNA_START=16 /DNA_END=251 /DNA_ORIENTATION=+